MPLSINLKRAFALHVETLEATRKRRQQMLTVGSLLDTDEREDNTVTKADNNEDEQDPLASMGEKLETDQFDGDAHLRSLNRLLAIVDSRGFERSSQQVQFHEAFVTACLRVLYKKDWALSKPVITKKLNIQRSFGEVMISTPRRFGKTFRHMLSPVTASVL